MKKNKKRLINISMITSSILFALLFTIIIGYICGFRAYLVNGWSSEPDIPYQSLVIDKKMSYDNLNVGDYITFGSGKFYTTHVIVAMAGKGDYADKTSFDFGEEITFESMGVIFHRKCNNVDGATIVTMTNNFNSYQEFLQPYLDSGDSPATRNQVPAGEGPTAEFNTIKQVQGKVINILPKTGQILFYVKNNFMQIVVYVIIFYIAMELLAFVPAYIKLF